MARVKSERRQGEPSRADGAKPAPREVAASQAHRRLWGFRLAALVLLPLLTFLLAEGVLRLAGYGYPVRFFQKGEAQGRAAFLNNPRYGWRFFPERLARDPWPFALPAHKAPGVIRVFVLGESAAMGDPDPRFGLPRMLEALLCQRFPQRRFEVVNVAWTAINSHVILPIARECARRQGDLWVIYMGNNEVVGPFGSGTVFGAQVPPLAVIRGGLAVKSCRVGQLLEAVAGKVRRQKQTPADWEGMEMFVEEAVRQDEPRTQRVYAHYQRNLEDILEAGRQSGAHIVLSTVGSNLRDCAPFGSRHRVGLSTAELAAWDAAYQKGLALEDRNDLAGALAAYEQARQVDDQFADLQFRIARCLRAQARSAEAAAHYRRARDEDVLRFRADTRINQIIRQCATGQPPSVLRLFDGEEALALGSPEHLTGEEFFFEHVHLTPAANYRLARGMAEQVAELLALEGPAVPPGPGPTNAPAPAPWASEEACLRWLGFTDKNHYDMIGMMLRRVAGPPFTQRIGHAAHLERLREQQGRFRNASKPIQIRRMTEQVSARLAQVPEDPYLRSNLAGLLELAGDMPGAEQQWREVLQRLPHGGEYYFNLGHVLENQGRLPEAARAYSQCLQLSPYHPKAGLCLAAVQRPRER
jgi:tetratricopeptide (TPR) repeat protein